MHVYFFLLFRIIGIFYLTACGKWLFTELSEHAPTVFKLYFSFPNTTMRFIICVVAATNSIRHKENFSSVGCLRWSLHDTQCVPSLLLTHFFSTHSMQFISKKYPFVFFFFVYKKLINNNMQATRHVLSLCVNNIYFHNIRRVQSYI